MRKFKFSLEKVLQHRKVLEDLAQADVQVAMASLNSEIDKLLQMDEAVIQARAAAFSKQAAGGRASAGLTQVYEFLKGQDIRRERQKEKIKECESLVEKLREILREKAIDYKIMEELKERKKAEWKVQQRKAEQKQADDMTVMRYRREEETK
jgi:flagellar FliJ protein